MRSRSGGNSIIGYLNPTIEGRMSESRLELELVKKKGHSLAE